MVVRSQRVKFSADTQRFSPAKYSSNTVAMLLLNALHYNLGGKLLQCTLAHAHYNVSASVEDHVT